jgi:hypothetical protein
MNRNHATLIKRSLWFAIGSFLTASVLYAAATSKTLNEIHCGNSVLDPLSQILNFGTPVAFVASIGLIVLARSGTGGFLMAISGGLLAIVTTIGLIQFGIWYHAEALDNHFQLSRDIWWL